MRTLDLHLPTGFKDLTSAQMVRIAALFRGENTRTGFLLKALMILTGLRPLRRIAEPGWYWFRKKGQKDMLLDQQEITLAANRLSFLLEKIQQTPIPRFFGDRAFRAPVHGLYNITVAQYLYAENAFAAFENTGRSRYLDELILALWKPRVKRICHGIIRRMDEHYKYACMLFYVSCRHFLADEFPLILKSEGGEGGKPDVTQMIRALNNGDVTKNETIMDCQLWDALKQLEDMAIQAERIKKASKR